MSLPRYEAGDRDRVGNERSALVSRTREGRCIYNLNSTSEKENTLNPRRAFCLAVMICVVAIGSGLSGGFGFADTSNAGSCDLVASAASCGRCGDGQCVKSCGETAQSCPKDCGGITTPSVATTVACGKCGDGRCVPQCGETATSCPKDCGGVPSTYVETPAPLQPNAVN